MLNPARLRYFALLLISVVVFASCAGTTSGMLGIDYRSEMKTLVAEIAEVAKRVAPQFSIFVNNGEELTTRWGNSGSKLDEEYLSSLDGFLIESLFFGSSGPDTRTPNESRNIILPYLLKMRKSGVPILVIDYCSEIPNRIESLQKNREFDFLAFPAPRIELDTAPNPDPPPDFLYLVNPGQYSRSDFVRVVAEYPTNHVFVDLYYGDEPLTAPEVDTMRSDPERRIYAYMSVGEASDFRPYWKSIWDISRPDWIEAANPNWPGSYRVRYWRDEWKSLLLDGEESYLGTILASGFDGVVLDGVDSYWYFESR